MTKYFIGRIAFAGLCLCLCVKNSEAKQTTKTAISIAEESSAPDQSTPKSSAEMPIKLPAGTALPHETGEKGHGHAPAMDETPHIHHFHKNRVKKLKRHHGKCWILSQVLVITCHVILLLIAYMHAAH